MKIFQKTLVLQNFDSTATETLRLLSRFFPWLGSLHGASPVSRRDVGCSWFMMENNFET